MGEGKMNVPFQRSTIRTAFPIIGAAMVLASSAQVGFAEETAKIPTNIVNITTKDTNRMPWGELVVPQINAKIPVKILEDDKTTGGMLAAIVKYPAGFTNPWHTHPTAHAMYVISGILKTHQGEFGPGTWVWYPEGGWMEHGATALSEVTVLFITNKKFDIKYPTDKDPWYPMNK
jgi:quercetin dioxygenase-like cupin family protein